MDAEESTSSVTMLKCLGDDMEQDFDENTPFLDEAMTCPQLDEELLQAEEGTKQVKQDPQEVFEVLTDNFPYLVENLDVISVLEVMKPALLPDVVESILAEASRGDKSYNLIECMRKEQLSTNMYDSFLKAVAGIQPDIFEKLAGRPPTVDETNYCVKFYNSELKQKVIETGHELDKKHDKKIDLDEQYVTLCLIETDNDFVHADEKMPQMPLDGDDAQLPSHYQAYVETSGRAEIKAEDILTSGCSGEKILLKGRAGVGKSTTMQYLSRRWAQGIWYESFALLFLIKLRALTRIDSMMTVVDLLTKYGLYSIDTLPPVRWLTNFCSRIIVLIDGLDEVKLFSTRLMTDRTISSITDKGTPLELCLNILKGNLLKGCTVISSSRPFTGLRQLQRDRVVEVQGLTQEGVMKFVDMNTPPEKSENVKRALRQNPMLMSACVITYYCVFLCQILCQDGTLSETFVNTYTQLALFIIVNYAKRNHFEQGEILEFRKYFPNISKLAFDGIMGNEIDEETHSKLVFTEADLFDADIDEDMLKKALDAGLLVNVNAGPQKAVVVEFVHFSVQELFAAGYFLLISPLNDDEKYSQIIKRLQSDGSYNMLLLYLYGLKYDSDFHSIHVFKHAIQTESGKSPLSFKIDKVLISYLTSLSKRGRRENDNSLLLQSVILAHESQSVSAATAAANGIISDDRTLNFTDIPLTAFDLTAMKFVWQTLDSLECISLVNTNLDDVSLQKLCEFIESNDNFMDNLKELDLSGNCPGPVGLTQVGSLLSKSTSLEKLSLDNNNITNDHLEYLQEGLRSNKSLVSLSLNRNLISDCGVKAITSCLQNKVDFGSLSLNRNALGEEGIQAICASLEGKTHLSRLSLNGATLTCGGSQAIANCLSQKSKFMSLLLDDCSIDDEGITPIALALRHCNDLVCVSMSENQITDQGLQVLAGVLENKRSISHVSLKQNQISAPGAQVLIDSCQRPHSVKIDLSGNQIDERQLKTSSSEVNLHGNTTNIARVQRLTESLDKGDPFSVLDVSSINLSDEGMNVLAKKLNRVADLSLLKANNNALTEACVPALIELVETHKALKIEIGGNDINKEITTAFAQASDCNQPSLRRRLSLCGYGDLSQKLQTLHLQDDTDDSLLDSGFRSMPTSSGSGIRDQSWTPFKVENSPITFNVVPQIIRSFQRKRCKSFVMKNCLLQSEHINQIATGFRDTPYITSLSIQLCQLRDVGAVEIAKALNALQVTTLDLSGNHIEADNPGMLTSELVRFKSLKSLSLADNHIGEEGARMLSASLKHLKAVQVLDLSENILGDRGAVGIREGLAHLKDLNFLNLNQNHIGQEGATSIVEALDKGQSLLSLDLSGNSLGPEGGEIVAKALCRWPLLTSLKVGNNNLGKTGIEYLGMPSLQTLEILDVCNNHCGPEGVQFLSKVLKELRTLKSLNLAGNDIGPTGAIVLSDGLSYLNSLTTLNLGRNLIGKIGIVPISKSLEGLSTLFHLDISENDLDSADAVHINSALKSHVQLHSLNIDSNRIGNDGIEALSPSLLQLQKLVSLDVSQNNLKNEAAQHLSCILPKLSCLSELRISKNNLESRGAQYISQALMKMPSLRLLEVDDNDLRSGGAKAVSEGLKNLHSLEYLNIANNSMGPDGAKWIAGSLRAMPSLLHLDMSGNGFLWHGMEAISYSLMRLTSLETLSLEDNNFSSLGSKHLSRCLPKLKKLRSLNIGKNYIGPRGAENLVGPLGASQILEHLELRENSLREEGGIQIARALSKIKTLKYLGLEKNFLGQEGTEDVCNSLKYHEFLTNLQFAENSMESMMAKCFSDSLTGTRYLLHLGLSKNRLGDKGLDYISEGLKSLKFLRVLSLGSNRVWNAPGITDSIFKSFSKTLTSLDLCDNGLLFQGARCLAESLTELNWLTDLNIQGNHIGAQGVKVIAGALQHVPFLSLLDVGRNELGNEGTKCLSENLKHTPHLTSLILRQNNCGGEAAHDLSLAIKDLTKLRTLNISTNDIGPTGAEAISQALMCLTSLETLRLGQNRIETQGMSHLTPSLSNLKRLRNLAVSDNDLGDLGGCELAQALSNMHSLRLLFIGNNAFSEDAVQAIENASTSLTSLTTLSINNQNFGLTGFGLLDTLLRRMVVLRELNIGNINLRDGMLEYLSKSLKSLRCLRALRISGNSLRSEGGTTLSVILPHLPLLEVLTISANNLGPNGCVSVSRGLASLKCLRELNICKNNIRDQGAKSLARAFREMHLLRCIVLNSNRITNEGAYAIRDALRDHVFLERVNFKSNIESEFVASDMMNSLGRDVLQI